MILKASKKKINISNPPKKLKFLHHCVNCDKLVNEYNDVLSINGFITYGYYRYLVDTINYCVEKSRFFKSTYIFNATDLWIETKVMNTKEKSTQEKQKISRIKQKVNKRFGLELI